MKLKDYLNKIDLTRSDYRGADILEEFEIELNTGTSLCWHHKFYDAVKEVPLLTWVCTDTHVGLFAYIWRGEIIAISHQLSRKGQKTIRFKNLEVAKKLRTFIRSLSPKVDEFCPRYFDVDMDMSSWE